jgi:hypothetical protein
VLTPLGGPAGLTPAQLNVLAQAVKDIGSALINRQIAKDVQSAAKAVQDNLRTIATSLETINDHYTTQISGRSDDIDNLALALLKRPPASVPKAEILAKQKVAAVPITPDAAQKALEAMVTANNRIATAGPTVSAAEIQSAWQAAQDAYAAYKALASR